MNKFRDNRRPIANEGYFINEQIRNSTVQVIDATGVNLGEMPRFKALEVAREAGLDLVKVGEKDMVAIAKVMDFGKFIYAKKKQTAKAKKQHKEIQIKEIKMRPKIGPGDYETKVVQAVEFLKEGKHVKFTLQFRGRQPVSMFEVGMQFFAKLKRDLLATGLNLVEEKEARAGGTWTKIFYMK